uniref:Transposase n=1 Tax=Kalanchoe fedtschenkoi TaxID=63787 RepID=A0A7N0TTA3_KALFE
MENMDLDNTQVPVEVVAQNVDNEVPHKQKIGKQRKKPQLRSQVWIHFTKFITKDGQKKAKCNYSPKEYNADPEKNGTTGMKIGVCPSNPQNHHQLKQTMLNLQPALKGQKGEGVLTPSRFNQEEARKGLAYMIIRDELPFNFVDHVGFQCFMSTCCPLFAIPSRYTVKRDISEVFHEQRKVLKDFLKESDVKICITTDTWTSLQNINYMSITSHFIDSNWKLHKRILNFCRISSHRGEALGKAVEKCLLDWDIDSVYAITVDNAKSNDTMVSYLRKKIVQWGHSIKNGEHLHVRCVAHVINRIVQDGLKEMSNSIFKECVVEEKIANKKTLCLDVPTRWNSTYLMLSTAEKFERAFNRYEECDPHLITELLASKEGIPEPSDWVNVRRFIKFLKPFYDLTLKVFGSSYITTNNFLQEIGEDDQDFEVACMASRMKEKFNKYWGSIDHLNFSLHLVVILDPRHKMTYHTFAFPQYFEDPNLCDQKLLKIKDAAIQIYHEYMTTSQQTVVVSASGISNSLPLVTASESEVGRSSFKESYKRYKTAKEGVTEKSELDRYLAEECEEEVPDFDLLKWWRTHSVRFPILASMARDVLAVPVSTVASESAFSTGGRILDPFRSSLSTEMVEMLVCCQDWLRADSTSVSMEENLDQIDVTDTGRFLKLHKELFLFEY